MASDRVNELYRGEIFDKKNQEVCRERVHWICSRVTGEKVLDFGCSQGIASILLGREGHQVVGVDVDPDVIEYAQAELEKQNESVREHVRFVLIKPGELEFDDDSFDSVLFGEVLEHLTRPDRALSAIQRLCKPDGHVIITTPFGHLRHPDHVHTYYLRDFLDTVRPFFGVRELDIRNKYICCLASNSGAGSDSVDVVAAERLLAVSETSFDHSEQDYLDHRERVRAQSHARRDEIQKLAEKLKVAEQSRRAENQKLAEKLNVAEQSAEAVRKLEGEVQQRDADLARLSRQHQVGAKELTEATDRIADLQKNLERAEKVSTKLKHEIERRDVDTKLLEDRQKTELTKLRASHAKALDQLRAGCERGIAQRHEDALNRLRKEHTESLAHSYAERERTLAAEARQHAQERKQIIQQDKASRQRIETGHAKKLALATREAARALKESAKLKKEVAVHQKAVRESRRKREHAEGAVNTLRSRLSRQQDQLEYTRSELDLRSREVRYRLGDALVSAYYHPSDLIRLPHRTVQLFLEGCRRNRQREADAKSEKELLAPTAFMQITIPEPGKSHSKPPPRLNGPLPAAESPPANVLVNPAPVRLAPSTREKTSESAREAPARPAAPQITFTPRPRPQTVARLPLTVGAIMDEFTYECFRDECHLVQFGSKDWKSKLIQNRPDLLLVESTWKGNGGSWKLQYPDNPDLRALVDWCKSQGIPTAFWNKEDPPNFDRFIDSAVLFDYIFTSDENCIPRYLERVKHKHVYALPFAAQPMIHNPIDSRGQRRGNLCFAGTFYQVKYPQRRRDLESLLRPARSRGLTIFDRQHGYAASKAYRFPHEFEPFIQGGLSYLEMIEAYKAFHIFLNVNSVRQSPTMFSRRVLELLASGTAVISTPATGMERMLGSDALAIADSEQEGAEWMDKLIGDPDFRERMVVLGQRRVFCEHTYEHRLRYILDTIGIQQPIPRRRVSVITVTNRPACLDDAVNNYLRQAYPDKEWIVVLNNDDYSLAQVKEKLAAVRNTRVFQRPQSDTLGACLNYAVDQSQYEFVAKFDDDDYYAEHYLTDMINAFLYSGTEIVGKRSYFAYLADKKCLTVRFPGLEHRHTPLVSGATMVVRRNLFEEQRFSEEIQRGVDTDFQRHCADRGFGVYSADRFNFVANRTATGHDHTWAISDEEFLEKCEVVAHLDDFRAQITV